MDGRKNRQPEYIMLSTTVSGDEDKIRQTVGDMYITAEKQ